jgi:hypothetical protein
MNACPLKLLAPRAVGASMASAVRASHVLANSHEPVVDAFVHPGRSAEAGQPVSVLALPEAELPGYMRVSLGTAQPAALLL